MHSPTSFDSESATSDKLINQNFTGNERLPKRDGEFYSEEIWRAATIFMVPGREQNQIGLDKLKTLFLEKKTSTCVG